MGAAKVFDSVGMDASRTSSWLNLEKMEDGEAVFTWAGTAPAGNITVELSAAGRFRVDGELVDGVAEDVTARLSGSNAVSGASGQINMDLSPFRGAVALRFKFNRTAGVAGDLLNGHVSLDRRL